MELMTAAPRSTRRDFLTGQAAADAAAHLAESFELPALPDESYLVRYARRAMACTFEVILNAGQHAGAGEAALAALDLVDKLEDQLSVFREESEVSRLNRLAAFFPVETEPRLFALLDEAARLHRATGGTYDVTSGRLSDVWGFKRRHGRVPPDEELAAALECVGSEHLELDREALTVRLLRPGVEINLGSIGKGYALDRCAEVLEGAGVHDFMLHGGSSSVLARGALAASAGDDPVWHVGVRNPLRPDRRLGKLRLADRALGTSGSGTQFFLHEGQRYGHILDPRSGWPAEGVLSATALAPTAAQADALATAFYVMGPEAVGPFCAERPDVAALLLCPGKRTGSLEIHRFGLADADWIVEDEGLAAS